MLQQNVNEFYANMSVNVHIIQQEAQCTCTYNGTLMRVRVTIFAVEKQ